MPIPLTPTKTKSARSWAITTSTSAFISWPPKRTNRIAPYIQGILNFDNTSPVSTGNAFADFLTGQIASFNQTNVKTKYYNRYKILEPYVQDDWRVTKKLTLNLGLRISCLAPIARN